MTRSTIKNVFVRASERVSSGAAAIALTALMLVSVDTNASENKPTPPSVTVSYSTYDFVNDAEAAKVYRKLKNAAREVCGVTTGAQLLEIRVARQQCYDEALAAAVQKVDRPTLTALHAAQARNFG